MKITNLYLKKIIIEEIEKSLNESYIEDKTLSKVLRLIITNVDKVNDLEEKFNLSKISSSEEYKNYIIELREKLGKIAQITLARLSNQDKVEEVIETCRRSLLLVNKFYSIKSMKVQVNNLSEALYSIINLLHY